MCSPRRTSAPEAEFRVVVTSREDVADGVVALTLAPVGGGQLPAWEPGAHIDLILGPGLIRQYSLCGDPTDTSRWTIAVLREKRSRGGSAFIHSEVGPRRVLHARGPRNNFPLINANRYVLIAGGIGITPILPMIRELDASGADWELLYGGRARSSMAFVDVLSDKYGARVTVWPGDERGLLDLQAALPSALGSATAVYCCGPGGLLDAVEQQCRSNKLGPPHVERFSPKEPSVDPGSVFEVVLARTGDVITIPAGTSILDAVEEHGAMVLSSCREGTCGSCEITLIEGVADHRDSVLSDGERADAGVIFICVSRAKSDRLVLDL